MSKTGGRSSKRKGTRVERWFVKEAEAAGLKSNRIPGSGAFQGIPGDVRIAGHLCECKARRSGFKQLEKWLSNFYALLLKPDRDRSMVVMWWDDWLELMSQNDRLQKEIMEMKEVDRDRPFIERPEGAPTIDPDRE